MWKYSRGILKPTADANAGGTSLGKKSGRYELFSGGGAMCLMGSHRVSGEDHQVVFWGYGVLQMF